MISKSKTREALGRLSENTKLGISKQDTIGVFTLALDEPDTNQKMTLALGIVSDVKGKSLHGEAREFVQELTTEKAKECYGIHGWDKGLHEESLCEDCGADLQEDWIVCKSCGTIHCLECKGEHDCSTHNVGDIS